MQLCPGLIACTLVLWSVVSTAFGQPPRRPEGPPAVGRSMPPATVVTRLNVNVETDVDVTQGPEHAAAKEDEEDEDESEVDDNRNGFKEFIDSVLNHAGPGSSINVITDININVETSIRVKCLSTKPTGTPTRQQDAQLPQSPSATSSEEAEKKPKGDGAPRKGRRRKQGQKSKETSAAAVQSDEQHAHIALNKLKLGENLEIGLTGQVQSDERAAAIAGQINSRTQRALLGVALLGMMVPSEQESLSVVRQAIGSVKADAAGNELSISAAIPRETPGAVKNLVEAALRR